MTTHLFVQTVLARVGHRKCLLALGKSFLNCNRCFAALAVVQTRAVRFPQLRP
jgi:hypothetical protein